MNLSNVLLPGFFICLSFSMFAQNVQRDPVTNDIINFQDAIFSKGVTEFRFENRGQGLLNESIPYDKINGSPFWRDSLQPARFYGSKGYITTLPARINIATNQIYFLQNAEEMILNDNIVTRIVFQSGNDSSVFIGQVPNLLLNSQPLNNFVQVLNFGKYQLLKYTRRKVASSESPSRTSKNYYFTDDINYFIMANEKIVEIEKLKRETFFLYLPSASSYNGWLKENNINFRNEKDILRFLDHYNAGLNK